MASKRNRSRGPKGSAVAGPKLAYELFSELNATFYEDDPSEYLLVKIEAVTLMLAPAEALTPAYESEPRGHAGPVEGGTRALSARRVRPGAAPRVRDAAAAVLRPLGGAGLPLARHGRVGQLRRVQGEGQRGLAQRLRSRRCGPRVPRRYGPGRLALDVEADEFDDTVSAWQLLTPCRIKTSRPRS